MLLVLLAALGLTFTSVLDTWLYFGLARRTPLAHYEYRGDLTIVSTYLNERARQASVLGTHPFLVLDDFSAQTVHFLTSPTNQPYRLLKPERSQAQALQPEDEMVFTQSTLSDASRYLALHGDVEVGLDRANEFGETVLLVLRPKP